MIVDLVERGTSETLAIAIGCLAGILAAMLPGVVNGVIIPKCGIPSFIVTLGMSFIARGVAFLLSVATSSKISLKVCAIWAMRRSFT